MTAASGARPALEPIAVVPEAEAGLVAAVERAGGTVAPLDERTRGIVWSASAGGADLVDALRRAPGTRWVQLPWAGVDGFADVLAAAHGDGRVWTSGKGVYAQPVAEHALALTLALLRRLPRRARADEWRRDHSSRSLFGARVVVLGAGGIAESLLRLLAPFGARVAVVRRGGGAVEGAERTVTTGRLLEVVTGADVLIVAAALTEETRGLVDAGVLAALAPGAVVVNVGRGPIVSTDALLAALDSGHLGGAGLDVTDPEPLPAGHALWSAPDCLITPHVADALATTPALLAERVEHNVRAFLGEGDYAGLIDLEAGY
ncbi:hydroxyacid dehydrogenase [Agromyces endophyticus]|uniref:NAD(P)-dependent oxidoreductase n=1 Tax=Agromyces sp. H17E-10 TaxID=2932244 RepID=UPI001FD27E54|nr:NAD(P)-dependent oxidoreductase [Agromyces sp. H17E-10]UOQ89342.1 hydroxyacid dehydrogenase [Agromyces sp. H17E-10]